MTSTHQPDDTFPLGTTTVTYTVTAVAGNTITGSFTITVVAVSWGDWGPWSACSVACGGGSRIRERQCETTDGGTECPEHPPSVSEECNTAGCPFWGEWGAYGECSVPCGGGSRSRTRFCIDPDSADSVMDCTHLGETPTDTNSCNDVICPTEPFWSTWGQFNECSAPCDGGTQTRTRSCIDDDATDAIICDGSDSSTRDCNNRPCPVWLDSWGNWGECSITCGGGTQERQRPCSHGDTCPGRADTDTRTCNTQICPTANCDIDCNTLGMMLPGFTTECFCVCPEEERGINCDLNSNFGGVIIYMYGLIQQFTAEDAENIKLCFRIALNEFCHDNYDRCCPDSTVTKFNSNEDFVTLDDIQVTAGNPLTDTYDVLAAVSHPTDSELCSDNIVGRRRRQSSLSPGTYVDSDLLMDALNWPETDPARNHLNDAVQSAEVIDVFRARVDNVTDTRDNDPVTTISLTTNFKSVQTTENTETVSTPTTSSLDRPRNDILLIVLVLAVCSTVILLSGVLCCAVFYFFCMVRRRRQHRKRISMAEIHDEPCNPQIVGDWVLQSRKSDSNRLNQRYVYIALRWNTQSRGLRRILV
ncbi:uncharacterized protein [Amphiura filiformis]|uniref:uncharacterized protein n=1 Tax=Amphiura filiformis TaxID=82378 RepID=UPI003B2139BD